MVGAGQQQGQVGILAEMVGDGRKVGVEIGDQADRGQQPGQVAEFVDRAGDLQ